MIEKEDAGSQVFKVDLVSDKRDIVIIQKIVTAVPLKSTARAGLKFSLQVLFLRSRQPLLDVRIAAQINHNDQITLCGPVECRNE
jgi:hypothetical protein